MISKSLHPDDYVDLQRGVAKAHKAYGWCLGHRVPIAWPHEHRLWEYASAFQAMLDYPIGPAHTVLDVGAGNSILGPQLALDGMIVKEVDSSPNVYTDRRNAVLAKYTDNFQSVKQDFFDVPLAETYNCVCSISVMEHIPEDKQKEAWEKLVAHLKPGGLLIATIDYSDTAGEWANAEGRATQFGPEQLNSVLSWLGGVGVAADKVDTTFYGNHVFDYSFYRIIATKPGIRL